MQDKRDELLSRMSECCHNATGAYKALVSRRHELPGYDSCVKRLDEVIAAYDAWKKENPTQIWRNDE